MASVSKYVETSLGKEVIKENVVQICESQERFLG